MACRTSAKLGHYGPRELSLRFRGTGGYGISTADRRQSGLMLAARITLPHFSVSAAICFPNSAGILVNTMAPKSPTDRRPGHASACFQNLSALPSILLQKSEIAR